MYVFFYCSTILWQNWQLSAGIALKYNPELPCFGLANQVLSQRYISKFLPILVLLLRQYHQVTKHASIIMWPLGLLHSKFSYFESNFNCTLLHPISYCTTLLLISLLNLCIGICIFFLRLFCTSLSFSIVIALIGESEK